MKNQDCPTHRLSTCSQEDPLLQLCHLIPSTQHYAKWNVGADAKMDQNLWLKLSALKYEVSTYEVEQKYFLQFLADIRFFDESGVLEKPKSSEEALEMWLLCDTYIGSDSNKGIFLFIKNILEKIGIINRKERKIRELLKRYSREQLIVMYQKIV